MTNEQIQMAKKPPGSLVSHLAGHRCILFAGSGLSAWGKLPTWRELLQTMIEKLSEEEPNMLYRKELDTLLEAGKLLEIADYCKEKLGDRLYGEILTDRLRGDMIVIPDPHKVIVDLPFSAVITTNYDKLLEQAYISQGKGMPRTIVVPFVKTVLDQN